MPRGDKSAYTNKQKRKAQHIEEGYLERGLSRDEAERRAWATVNKESGGGNKSGSGRGVPDNTSASHKGGRLGTRRRIAPGRSAFTLGAQGGGHPQAARGLALTGQAMRLKLALRDAHDRILDEYAGIRRTVLLHQLEQHRRV